ncbi:MAG: hypothetical protein IH623_30140 [Verrucomicrobia bacterium]|nr:hypothetical protein [Verrucomicrobiota bacterium]
MSKRRLRLLGKLMLALVVLCCAFLLFERIRGQIALASFKRELAAKGEKLTPQELSAFVPEVDNGAPAFHEAVGQIQEGVALPNRPPPTMSILPSGRAIVGYREEEWVEDETTNRWEQVELDLQTNAVALVNVRAALEKLTFDNDLDYEQGADLLLPHLATGKPVCVWLGAETQLAIRQGRSPDVRSNLVAQAHLPRTLAEDRLLISELVRIAIATIARSSLWEALQSDALTEEDLQEIQGAWATQSFADNMARGLEGDRIYSDVTYDLLRRSNEKTVQVFYGLEEWLPVEEDDRPWWEKNLRAFPFGEGLAEFIKRQVYCRIWRLAWSHQAQRQSAENFHRLAEITQAAVTNQSLLSVRSRIEEMEEEVLSGNFYSKLRFPSPNSFFTLTKCVSKAMQAETERSFVLCAIALKRHFLRHSEHPETLDALMPEFLSAVPIDYMDGQPMKYRRNTDGSFTLYSVGEDGVDDGGDASLQPDRESFRNLWHRKDFVWPQPALPEEVDAWRKEAGDR